MKRDIILILGGTKEAAELADNLVDQGHNVTTSLAGRTAEPASLSGCIRTGGFGGVQGLADWMVDNGVTKLIDATHPFAEQISRNAREAATLTGVPLKIETRSPWSLHPDDDWTIVSSLSEAAQQIQDTTRVFLALGSQHLSAFEHRDKVHFVIRMIDPPKTSLMFKNYTLVLGRPASGWRSEAELMKQERITHMICRNSGGDGAYAKIEAARRLQLPVIILSRKH